MRYRKAKVDTKFVQKTVKGEKSSCSFLKNILSIFDNVLNLRNCVIIMRMKPAIASDLHIFKFDIFKSFIYHSILIAFSTESSLLTSVQKLSVIIERSSSFFSAKFHAPLFKGLYTPLSESLFRDLS